MWPLPKNPKITYEGTMLFWDGAPQILYMLSPTALKNEREHYLRANNTSRVEFCDKRIKELELYELITRRN